MSNRTTKEVILGYEVNNLDPVLFLENVYCELFSKDAKSSAPRWLACLNPHSYAIAKKDKTFSAALRSADWLVPDGMGVVLASRIFGGNIRHRITGAEVFFFLLDRLNASDGGSIFFLGSSEANLSAMKAKAEIQFPNLQVLGTYSPPFKDAWSPHEIDVMIAAINEVKPDILWVGMTAPKQEKWIYENRNRLNVKFIGAVGAVFDFYTGQVKRPSALLQTLGLEWLVRLARQPRRLWRRTFISAPIFFFDVLKCILSHESAK